MDVDWLKSALVCESCEIRPSLDPVAIRDKDLPDICLRMHLILDTIEFARCEGRLIDRNVFDPIDTLYSDLTHERIACLSDWRECIVRFGDYYDLDGIETIEISPRALSEHVAMSTELNVKLPR
jgi:hypothetical protein